MGKVSAEGIGQLMKIAGKDGVSGEATGAQNGIGEIADELRGVVALDGDGSFDRGIDRLHARDIQENYRMTMLLPDDFEGLIAGCEMYGKAFVVKFPAQRFR